MNTRIKMLLNNNKAKAADYFNMVNMFDYSMLSVLRDRDTVISMDINQFEEYSESYELGQRCTNNHYAINKDNIKEISGKMLDDTDTFFIEVSMLDGMNVNIFIYHTDTNEKTESYEGYEEWYDVYSLQEYFDNENHVPITVIMRDVFGMETKFLSVKYCSLTENEDETSYTMRICNEDENSIVFTLFDDSCNEIYMKKGSTVDAFLIHPYGQPYMEVLILVSKTE